MSRADRLTLGPMTAYSWRVADPTSPQKARPEATPIEAEKPAACGREGAPGRRERSGGGESDVGEGRAGKNGSGAEGEEQADGGLTTKVGGGGGGK